MTFTTETLKLVSVSNSSTIPLNGDQVFTGTSEDVSDYNVVHVTVFSDVPGKDRGLSFQYSSDGTNWDVTNELTFDGLKGAHFSEEVKGRFFRLVYTNGPNDQSVFRIQSIFKVNSQRKGAEFVPHTDGTGRLRVSEPLTMFDSRFTSTKRNNQWCEINTNGYVTYNVGVPLVDLQISAGQTGKVIRQTREYFAYQTGKSMYVMMAGVILVYAGVTGATSRIGMFDDKNDKLSSEDNVVTGNGIFFQHDGTTFSIGKRDTFYGIQTDIIVNQSDFNHDPMDGTGPSGIVFDPTKRQLFWIQQQWFGVGTISCGIVINEHFHIMHKFTHANTGSALPYMSAGSLPIRYEVSGSPANTHMILRQISSTVVSEGGFSDFSNSFAFGPDFNTTVQGSDFAVLTMRLRSSRRRSYVSISSLKFFTMSSNSFIYFKIYHVKAPHNDRGPLNSKPLVWYAAHEDSSVEFVYGSSYKDFNIYAYDYTMVKNGFFSDATDFNEVDLGSSLKLNADVEGYTDYILVACKTTNNTSETMRIVAESKEYD